MKKVVYNKIEIGQRFKDDKRDLTIIDRKYERKERINKKGKKSIENKKYYKYRCNKCGFECGEHYRKREYQKELWVEKSKLLFGKGCACCHSQIVVPGINDIPTTAPFMIKYFQGGYNEAKKYSRGSSQKIYPICPDCGRVKNKSVTINNLYHYPKTCICNDSVSIPEKTIYCILEQLKIDFIYQLSKSTLKWCNKYLYDFYFKINNEAYILETHGLQHYQNSFSRCGGKTLEEEQQNDKNKKELALQNGIKSNNYVVIDCRYSTLEWIKEHILSSRLAELFDLNKIDWKKAEEFALSNLVKQACNYWNQGIHSTVKIGKIMKLNRDTIRNYLKRGIKLNWCNYNPKEEQIKGTKIGTIKCKQINSKKIICLNNNKMFDSVREVQRILKIERVTIMNNCKGKLNYAGIDPHTNEFLQWQYYDEYLVEPKKLLPNDEIKKIRERNRDRVEGKKIICLNNNKMFNSIAKAARFYQMKDSSHIGKCCKGKEKYSGKDPKTGEKLHWMYYEDYLNKKINKEGSDAKENDK